MQEGCQCYQSSNSVGNENFDGQKSESSTKQLQKRDAMVFMNMKESCCCREGENVGEERDG